MADKTDKTLMPEEKKFAGLLAIAMVTSARKRQVTYKRKKSLKRRGEQQRQIDTAVAKTQ